MDTNFRFSNLQREYYHRQAKDYDGRRFWKLYCRQNRNHIKKIEKVLEIVKKEHPKSILEVGTGTGIHAEWFLRNYENNKFNFTGVDLSPDMLSVAKKRLQYFIDKGKAKLKVANALSLPFKNEAFDFVFCVATIHHLEYPETGIREMVRVLKSGHKLVVVEPNRLFPLNLYAGLTNPIERNVLKLSKNNLYLWGKKYLDKVKVENLLYTPPYPAAFKGVFDRLDLLFSKVPLLNNFSIMLFMSGEKTSR
ncbi:16S rRNA (cytosine(1402)-N(4))-methyltransferase [Candidatus Woesebacteria bacterium RIFCSPLOWO2_01_FULL_39_10b]|uniref:16S rRNA (Cytosine(1402)-N(4))-methyltransferase n=1 Tax=Candidatus Woesebacteria bacterium RIFCSPLOWO2_01_FULL_39_10b TaxID=1802517 RepID=A0A1F8B879_9BACT|nr:MAG: 16S rRNA (cytosine(1402)-N(4))-methyltransferase [Candidatus Woesebacteria bacterium RIFCSPLOWO2_01_FULL_39_10b]